MLQQHMLTGRFSQTAIGLRNPQSVARLSRLQLLGACCSSAAHSSPCTPRPATCQGYGTVAILGAQPSSRWRSAAEICHAQRKQRTSNSSSSSSTQDQLITPLDPSSGPVIPLGSSSRTGSSSITPGAASTARDRAKTNVRHDSRRGALVKIRVAPRRYRLRQSFDQPRRIHVSPEDPSFEGRLTSEINSCYGPRQLSKLLQDFGPYLTAAHCASAISLLAGMATGQQQQQLEDTYQAPATRAAELLTARISQASLLDCARATYGLARLQLHMPALLQAAATHSRGQLVTATPQALAGLAAGLAHWGYAVDEGWQQELCVESFAQMSGFGAQDLANLMFALAVWQRPVSQPFLQRILTAFRGHWGSAGCHAPTLVRFMFALTQLPPCQPLPPGMQQALPEGSLVYQHHEEWRRQQQQRELSRVVETEGGPAASADEGRAAAQQQQQQRSTSRAADGWRGPHSSSSSRERQAPTMQQPAAVAAAATYRLPSFNWLTAFLAEARRQIDRMRPAELSSLLWCMASLNHTPDLIFMECWYRAAAARMHAFSPQSLALSLQALGMLRPGTDVPGGVSGRWLQAALLHSRGLLGCSQQQQQQQQQCGGQELARLLWGFGELRFWPGQAWMDDWLAATQPQLASMQPSDLTDTVWALARLRYTPPQAWTQTLTPAVTNALPGFSAQGLAMVIWGFSRLGLRPERQWLLRFKSLSGGAFEDENAQQLAQFVAGLLAQQNRQRFSAQGRMQRAAS